MERLKSIDDFKALQGRLKADRDPRVPTIVIPAGTCGQASGANDLIRMTKREYLDKGLTDRIRLRPLTAAVNDNMLYLSSEEASIRLVDDNVSRAWIPRGGEPIIGRLETQGILHNGEPVKTAVEGY